MNKQRMVILMVGVLLWCEGLAKATLTNWDIYSSTTIGSGTYETVNIYDSQTTPPVQTTVTMTGGSANILIVHDSSVFQLQQNGTVSGWISAGHSSNVIMSGGSTGDLELFNSAVANISGGEITGHLGIWGEAEVYIYGKNFTSTPDGGNWIIEGQWADNTSFSIYYRISTSVPPPGEPGSNVHLVPEPCTFGLFGFGILFAKRSIRRFRK